MTCKALMRSNVYHHCLVYRKDSEIELKPRLAARAASAALACDRSQLVNAQHFQPSVVVFGLVPNQIRGFDRSLRLAAIVQIDQSCTLRADHIHAQAQRLRLSLTVQTNTPPQCLG